MTLSAEKMVHWCNDNVSPVAWQLVVIKALPQLRAHGLELSDLMNPTATLMLPEDAFKTLASCIEELYQTQLMAKYVSV